MKKQFCLLFILFFLMLQVQSQTTIIPSPVSMQVTGGDFVITKSTTVTYNTASKELKAAAIFLRNQVEELSGYNLSFSEKAKNTIALKLVKEQQLGPEGYHLAITDNMILVSANTKAGIVYGMQSLFQLLPAIRTNAPLSLPCMQVTDYPRFSWRGMHLDVSRHFFSPKMIKEYIDLMAMYKMNVFHWHLTDSQGWRIEIKKYPQLTAIGAWRVDYTDLDWKSRPPAKEGEAAGYGGYYTQEQIKEIIQYAAVRNITIVPEIEMPGHSAAAIASYPFLSCTGTHQLPMTGSAGTGISQNFCAGKDSVFVFLQNVLSEVISLFPSQYIHIGGDEVDKTSWKHCPFCQARMKAEGLKDENELQSYFIRRIEKFIISKHRKLIGWDEILEGGLAPEATVMSWRGEAGGIEAAKMKHNVVMTPGYPVYFDHYQAGPEGEPIAFGGMNTLKNVYDYEPVPKELNASESQYVLGAQANVWTEYISTAEHLEYMVLPRMAALSEVLWSSKENRNWKSFSEKIQTHYRRYGQKGWHYCPGNFVVSIKPKMESGKLFASLSTEITGADIYYTTDGTEPGLQSAKYNTPIAINQSTILKAVTVQNGHVMSLQAAKQSFVMHKAIGKNVVYQNPVSKYYPADGPNSLTDGIRGTSQHGKFWHGISGNDLIATVDLEKIHEIGSITLGCLQNYGAWIFLPKSVRFEISEDGINFKTVKTIENTISINQPSALYDFKAVFSLQPARFVRIKAVTNNCPPGHPGAGKPGWIFADELIVE
jgi:hexosaminidase